MADLEIIRYGIGSKIKGDWPHELKDTLTFKSQKASFNRDLRFKDEITEFWDVDESDGSLMFCSGFIKRVHSFLLDKNYNVSIEDKTGNKIPKPDYKKLSGKPRKWQIGALKALKKYPFGVFDVATGSGKTWLLTEIPKIYDAKIAIVGRDSGILRSIFSDLKGSPIGKDVAGLGKVGFGEPTSRVVVCCDKSLQKLESNKIQILLYDEVHNSASPAAYEILQSFRNANFFGFSASPKGRLDNRDPHIESLFGNVIFGLSHKELVKDGVVNPVEARIYRCSTPNIDITFFDNKIGKKRRVPFVERMKRGYIRNNPRNEFIAKIANQYKDRSVLILCRNDLEHLFRLYQYLPDYHLVYGPGSMWTKAGRYKNNYNKLKNLNLMPSNYEPLKSGEQYMLEKEFRDGKINKVLCTNIWREGIDLPDLEVIIRADGDPGEIPSTQSSGRVVRKKDRKSILVDFYDDFGSLFLNRSQSREKTYKDIGYTVKLM